MRFWKLETIVDITTAEIKCDYCSAPCGHNWEDNTAIEIDLRYDTKFSRRDNPAAEKLESIFPRGNDHLELCAKCAKKFAKLTRGFIAVCEENQKDSTASYDSCMKRRAVQEKRATTPKKKSARAKTITRK